VRQRSGGSGRGGQFFIEKIQNTLGEMFRQSDQKCCTQFPGIAGNAEAIGNTDHGELQRESKILALLEKAPATILPKPPT